MSHDEYGQPKPRMTYSYSDSKQVRLEQLEREAERLVAKLQSTRDEAVALRTEIAAEREQGRNQSAGERGV